MGQLNGGANEIPEMGREDQNQHHSRTPGTHVPVATLCNKYQIRQSLFAYWLKEFQTKAHKVFDTVKQSKKEQRLQEENKKLKRIIAELTIELKKTELELSEGNDL